MSWTLAEGAVNAVITYLSANMTAKLAAFDAEYTDSLVLTPPVSYEISEKTLKSIPKFPVAVIMTNETEVGYWHGAEILGEHKMIMGVIHLEQDKDILKRKLYRYARAVMELLADLHSTNPPFMIGKGAIKINFSPIFGNESDFVADVQLEVPVDMKELR